jgi:hypothetical protein
MEWLESKKDKNTIQYIAIRAIPLAIKEIEYKFILLGSKILFSKLD